MGADSPYTCIMEIVSDVLTMVAIHAPYILALSLMVMDYLSSVRDIRKPSDSTKIERQKSNLEDRFYVPMLVAVSSFIATGATVSGVHKNMMLGVITLAIILIAIDFHIVRRACDLYDQPPNFLTFVRLHHFISFILIITCILAKIVSR